MRFSKVHKRLLKQRRFRVILVSLVILSLWLGIIVVPIERAQGNIKTVEDGIWWAVTTVTTVGFGDLYPVTTQGRVIGMVLEITGAVMFGVLIAIIGSSMNRSQEEFYWNRIFDRINELEAQLAMLQKQTGYIVKERDKDNTEKRFASAVSDQARKEKKRS